MSDEQKAQADGGHILNKEKTEQELADGKNAVEQAKAVKADSDKAAEGKAKLQSHFDEIEKLATELVQMIEAIPAGVQHGWHSLAAEINARVKR